MNDNSLVQEFYEHFHYKCDSDRTAHSNFNMELRKKALQQSADINKQDREGNTLLHLACSKLYGPDFLKFLISLRPNMNIQNNFLETPLIIFIRSIYYKSCALSSLLEMGADPNIPDRDGNTPLHYLAGYISHKLLYFREFTEILLKFNANVNIQNNNGETPLHWAVQRQAVGFVKILLENGASIFTKNEKNLSPIDLAYINRGKNRRAFIQMGKHALILNICNVPIRRDILIGIHSNQRLRTFKEKCIEELLGLKDIKVGNSNISLYVILKSSTGAFAKYLRNSEVLEWFRNFESGQYKILGDRLNQHFKEGLARKEAEEYAYPACRKVFQILPELCIDKIMMYLTNDELYNLGCSLNKRKIEKELQISEIQSI